MAYLGEHKTPSSIQAQSSSRKTHSTYLCILVTAFITIKCYFQIVKFKYDGVYIKCMKYFSFMFNSLIFSRMCHNLHTLCSVRQRASSSKCVGFARCKYSFPKVYTSGGLNFHKERTTPRAALEVPFQA